jgi:hypothetical protein
MLRLFQTIDRLLRGEFTRRDDLLAGRVDVPVATLVVADLVLGCSYGAFMGLYAALRKEAPSTTQLAYTTVKVPLLFLLTLFVTFPSLYVFGALGGSVLRFRQSLRLLLVALTVNFAVLASFGPVTGFFTLSTDSYPFMVLLNVVVFAIAGLIGVGFLRRALRVLFDGDPAAATVETRQRSERSQIIFTVWSLIFGVVGAQMAWILRPFVGTPELPAEFLRPRESNFFAAVIEALQQLFAR